MDAAHKDERNKPEIALPINTACKDPSCKHTPCCFVRAGDPAATAQFDKVMHAGSEYVPSDGDGEEEGETHGQQRR